MNAENKKRILIVEDEESIRELLERTLQRGYDVRVAADGHEGLRIARPFRPDLLLLDVMLPGMSGFELARELRNIPGLESVPLAFLTAKDDPKSMAEGIVTGARHYIVKPVNLQELMKLVARMLGQTSVGT